MIEKGESYKIVLFKDFESMTLKGIINEVDDSFIKLDDLIINKKFIFSLEKLSKKK